MSSNRLKEYTRLIDANTGELIIAADLTPAAVKRLIKEYARFDYELKAVDFHYELTAAV
jgi:hypothetical protein